MTPEERVQTFEQGTPAAEFAAEVSAEAAEISTEEGLQMWDVGLRVQAPCTPCTWTAPSRAASAGSNRHRRPTSRRTPHPPGVNGCKLRIPRQGSRRCDAPLRERPRTAPPLGFPKMGRSFTP